MPIKSMKELSQPLTLTIPEDSPIYKALMESTKQKNDDEHKIACLEADLEETTNILNAEISDLKIEVETWKDTSDKWNEDYHKLLKEHEKLKEENEKLKEKGMKFKKWYDEYQLLAAKYGGAFVEDLDNFIISLKKENEKLKEELKKRANVFMAYSADEL
jgi:predicted  nucleic acid-binding Zn-ribbon protein